MRVRCDAQLPALSLLYGENSCSILTGRVIQTLHGAIICKNWHLCGGLWEDCNRNNLHFLTPPEVATTVAGLLKAAWEDSHERLQPSGDRASSPRNPQSDLTLTNLGKCSRLSGWMAKRQYKDNNSLFSSTTIVANIVDALEHNTTHPALTAITIADLAPGTF